MKTVPVAMQTDLDSGATHHCMCWRVERSDAQVFGFTDHDVDLTFLSTTFRSNTGLTPSAIEQSIGLNVDNMDVMGVLNSISIDEQDIAAGLYDDAEITAYRVDWRDTTKRVILLSGTVGEVSRGRIGFTAEVRGLAHKLNLPTGESYLPVCRVDLGSTKCGINMAGTSVSGHAFTVAGNVDEVLGLNAFRSTDANMISKPNGWFSRGLLTWTSGNNNGLQMEVKLHSLGSGAASIYLWIPMPFVIQVGDTYSVQAGCDKSPDNCVNKIGNTMANFRGFNLIPGNDTVLKTASNGDDNNGGSIFGL